MDDDNDAFPEKGAPEEDSSSHEGGMMQTELLHDVVFDPSLPLKPPPRPRKPVRPASYSPHSDPDTIDLFGDVAVNNPELLDEELDHEDDWQQESALGVHSQELRDSLAEELTSILAELDHPTGG